MVETKSTGFGSSTPTRLSQLLQRYFPDGEFVAEPARDMGYAAARFWHIMFLENVYEPALECAELLLEGVGKLIEAAGGMLMVDPLFQRVLVNHFRNKNMPIIFYEIFTGFWPLGTETAVELLNCVPDGTIPLAATLATSVVFDSFLGDSKPTALLHGHSYSAQTKGCTAAAKSIKRFKDPQLWDEKMMGEISSHPAVKRVVALGNLYALHLRAKGSIAGSLLKQLREDVIYTRPLGNVIHFVFGPCTSPEICRQLLVKLCRKLDKFSQSR